MYNATLPPPVSENHGSSHATGPGTGTPIVFFGFLTISLLRSVIFSWGFAALTSSRMALRDSSVQFRAEKRWAHDMAAVARPRPGPGADELAKSTHHS